MKLPFLEHPVSPSAAWTDHMANSLAAGLEQVSLGLCFIGPCVPKLEMEDVAHLALGLLLLRAELVGTLGGRCAVPVPVGSSEVWFPMKPSIP